MGGRRARPAAGGGSVNGGRAADAITRRLGSWPFILLQSSCLGVWLFANMTLGQPVDPPPFILLNLLLSFQAAYTGPIVLMSQNRADRKRDRTLEAIYALQQEQDVELHQRIEMKLDRIVSLLVEGDVHV
jgi:uncharacterized membrane protein